jgi:hypothetical protein
MPNTYDDKAIKGSQLERLTTKVLEKVVEKQDVIDAEYDAANGMIVLNNIDISVASST